VGEKRALGDDGHLDRQIGLLVDNLACGISAVFEAEVTVLGEYVHGQRHGRSLMYMMETEGLTVLHQWLRDEPILLNQGAAGWLEEYPFVTPPCRPQRGCASGAWVQRYAALHCTALHVYHHPHTRRAARMAAIETELEEMRAFITEEILPAVDLIVHDVEHEITCMLRVWVDDPCGHGVCSDAVDRGVQGTRSVTG
jgi:hypothetical protein